MLSCGPPIAQIRSDQERRVPAPLGARYSPRVLPCSSGTTGKLLVGHPCTPGWLECLRALRLPHRPGDLQRTKGLLAHRVPFPTPRRLQSQSVWAAPPNPQAGCGTQSSLHP